MNDSTDRGGETFRGISRKFWPIWPGWEMIDQVKELYSSKPRAIDGHFFHNLEMDNLVEDFYFENFWTPIAELGLPKLLTAKLFDTSVHLGKVGGIRILQKTLNELEPIHQLIVDGKYGPRTSQKAFSALQSEEQEIKALNIFSVQQATHYKSITEKDASQKKYLKGWLSRAAWRPN